MDTLDSFGNSTGTHQPLIRAVMELYSPEFVLELGIGLYSTPIFLEYKTKYIGIENDVAWIINIMKIHDVTIRLHNLPDVTIGMQSTDLTEAQKTNIRFFYDNIKLPNIHPRLLFVDQWASCRTLSINTLADKFDMIIYHDSEPAGAAFNRYDLIDVQGFNKYTLKSSTAWTSLLIRQDKGFDLLSDLISVHIRNYKALFNETYMELENNS